MVANPPSKNTERRILWFLILILTLAILDLKSGERAKHTNDAAVMVEKNHQHKINSAQMPKVDVKDRDETMSSFRREEKRREEKGLSEGERQQEGLTCPGYQNPEKLEGKPSWLWMRTMKTGSTSLVQSLKVLSRALQLESTDAGTGLHADCAGYEGSKDIHPRLTQHVGYQPCAEKLLRGYDDGNFVKFMAFRHPVERVISAWKYGMRYGIASAYMSRPVCRVGDNISFARYLQTCPKGTDNHYLQMLDPENMNITTALQRLDDRVLILLQGEMTTSMERFKSIILDPVVPDNGFVTELPHLNLAGSQKRNATGELALESIEVQELLQKRLQYDWILYERAKEIFDFQGSNCL